MREKQDKKRSYPLDSDVIYMSLTVVFNHRHNHECKKSHFFSFISLFLRTSCFITKLSILLIDYIHSYFQYINKVYIKHIYIFHCYKKLNNIYLYHKNFLLYFKHYINYGYMTD